jgi:hypothetical protein
MSDPLRYDEQRPLDPTSEADRAAKIEQLLLAGLDHYFASQYEQAVNVWTRALFLDRAHPRARAYIERARSAQAERQRESEELLQRGVHAFNQGEAVEARRLLRDAMDRGPRPRKRWSSSIGSIASNRSPPPRLRRPPRGGFSPRRSWLRPGRARGWPG